MFTVALLLVAFALIAGIVSTTTRRRPRPPVPPIHFSHAGDVAPPVDAYVLAGAASPEAAQDAGRDGGCDSAADNDSDCDGGDSGGPD